MIELGHRRYRDALELMRDLHARVANGETPETWLVVEHDPVITLGRNARAENVLVTSEYLTARGIDCETIERGGDATYHGPGQLVIYPLMKLERFREVAPTVAAIESAVTETLAGFGIAAHTRKEHRGVYVGDNAIAAIGLAVKRMTTLHGVALNVSNELDYDRLITPCGTPEFGITSMSHELGRDLQFSDVIGPLMSAFERAFDRRFERASEAELRATK